jgi:hypothetical protein
MLAGLAQPNLRIARQIGIQHCEAVARISCCRRAMNSSGFSGWFKAW